jgi:hypothetical protein
VLRDLQRSFRAAVTGDSDDALAPHVRSPRGNIAARIDVYRTTVQESLADVLATAFPVTQRIVGPAFFRGIAGAFIAAHPPRAPQLSAYGDALPDFIAGLAPARDLPYLPDVARLEWARSDSYFAADAAHLDPRSLQALAPDALESLELRLHPATRIVPSSFPILTIWEVNQPDIVEVPPVDLRVPQRVLVTRMNDVVLLREIGAADMAFVTALAAGAALSDAAEMAAAVDAGFDLQTALQDHLLGGTFAALTP